MGLFKNLKVMKEHMAAGWGGEGPTEEALASLTPEQRAAYDANMARVAAATAEASSEHTRLETQRRSSRALLGPAAEYVYGPTADTLTPEQMAAMSGADMLDHSMQQTEEQFKDLLKNPFGGRKAPPPPMAPPSGPVDRATQAAAERAARDTARAPYLAPEPAPVAFARLATRGKTQVEEVASYLASSGLAARPDLVYGVYRVPDHIHPGSLRGERGGMIEWDIIHAATEALPPARSAPSVAAFTGTDRWVARRVGEPSVLDEDLALAYLDQAGIGPEQCLGIARHLSIRNHGGGDDGIGITLSLVTGVNVLQPAGAGATALEHLRAARPLELPAGSPAGVHVEVLNWRDIARAVHPEKQKPFAVPSPFPYLPSTAQELVRAYLEIVGVRPADCYSAQVTEDRPRDIRATGSKLGGLVSYSTNVGEKQPCADGKDRSRLAGGAVVVIAYRDRDDYAPGRERWAAYERDVLQTALANGTGARRAVEKPDYADGKGVGPRLLRTAERVASVIEFFDDEPVGDSPFDDLDPHRYCWPPVTG
jgi:hypothetical protein